MIFRPLCIDYRSRAQEVCAVERDAHARRAARSLLPHPHHHRDGTSRQAECNQHVSAAESMTRQDENHDCSNTNMEDNYRSNSHRHLTSKTPSLRTIYELLGPAVHPSECALRDIEPVTRGPIRGKKHTMNVKPVLQEFVAEHDRIMQGELKGVVMSLESGRSRFDFSPLMMEEKEDRDFLYSLNFHSEARVPSNYAVDTMTPTKSSTSLPMYIRHQPPNLTRIYQLKSLRARDPILFGDILSNMFQPEFKSLSEGELSDFRRGDSAKRGCFAGPRFDLDSICGAQTNSPNYSSRDTLVSFSNFLELDSKEDTLDGTTNIRQHSVPSDVLESLDDYGFCFLRKDPDLPQIDEGLAKIERKDIHMLLNKSLDGLSSASFISTKLKLPNRFEEGHDLVQDSSRFLVSVEGPQFKLLGDFATEQHMACLKAIESLNEKGVAKPIGNGAVVGSRTFLPRKISLESSIKLFDEVEMSEVEQRPSTTEMLSRLSSFSSQFTFASNFSEKGKALQKCHVKSTTRVSELRSLQNIIGDNATAYLFLPRIDVSDQTKATQDYSQRCPPTKEDAIDELVRSCVPYSGAPRDIQLPKQQKSDYPIKHWFSSNGTGLLPSNETSANSDIMPDDLQKEISKLKRSAFCEKAQTAYREETQRNLIITGCSARRNAAAIYTYRGILTNSPLDPRIYQTRYALMLDMQKTNRLKPASRSSFVDMAQGIMVSSLLRDGKRKKRGAQLADRLRTQRHETLEVCLEQKHEQTRPETRNAMKLTSIARMASSVRNENPAMTTSVEKLGKTLKRERGELLHLVAKADELEKEEQAYVEELAVLNGHPKNMKEDLFDFAIESDGKRKVPIEEHHEKKHRKKKSRKRDETAEERIARRAKKKKRKEHRNRKTKRDRHSEGTSDVSKKAKFLDAQDATATRILSVAPSVQLGITPIMPPKQHKVLQQPNLAHDKSGDNVAMKNVVGSLPASHKIKDSTLLSVLKSSSPDSVASINEGRKLLFSQKKSESKMSHLNTHQETVEKEPEQIDLLQDVGGQKDDACIEYEDDQDKEIPVIKGYDCGKPVSVEVEIEVDKMTFLSSESFLEEFSEVITALATGNWNESIAPHEKNNIIISIFDCPLVDVAGVDIELSSEKGVIVNRLSSWLKRDQQNSSRAFIRRLVSLAASGRYKCLHVVICIDTDVSSTLANEISTLQNALVQQNGCRCEVTFEFVKPQVLSATLALHLISNQTQGGGISDSNMNENTVERARFLMMLVPSMTVHMALGSLGCCEKLKSSNDSGRLLHDLLFLAKKTSRSDFVKNASTMLSDVTAQQLWLAVQTDLSNGH